MAAAIPKRGTTLALLPLQCEQCQQPLVYTLPTSGDLIIASAFSIQYMILLFNFNGGF